MSSLKSLLLYRLTLFNGCVIAFLAWAGAQGMLRQLFEVETTGIGYALVVLTLATMVS